MKKAIISGVLFGSILLAGCNTNTVLESEQEIVVSQGSGENHGISDLLSELQNGITASITEHTELKSDSLAIMVDGGTDELIASVGFPKDAKIDDTLIQQIVEESVQNISETGLGATEEEKITVKIKIERY